MHLHLHNQWFIDIDLTHMCQMEQFQIIDIWQGNMYTCVSNNIKLIVLQIQNCRIEKSFKVRVLFITLLITTKNVTAPSSTAYIVCAKYITISYTTSWEYGRE